MQEMCIVSWGRKTWEHFNVSQKFDDHEDS